MTLVHAHMSWWHLSILGICQLLLIQFWPNFKGRILGPSLEDANSILLSSQHMSWRHLSISAISQLLLSQFLPNFWEPIFFGALILFWNKFILTLIFFRPTIFVYPKFFYCLHPNIFWSKKFFCQHLDLKYFEPTIFNTTFFWTQIFGGPKF